MSRWVIEITYRAAANDDVDTLLSWQLAGITFADKEWLGLTPMKVVRWIRHYCVGLCSKPLFFPHKAMASNAQKVIQFLTNSIPSVRQIM